MMASLWVFLPLIGPNKGGGDPVLTPFRQIIDCTKERNIYQLKLKDSLLSNLNFVKVGQKEIEVAWIRGRIDYFR